MAQLLARRHVVVAVNSIGGALWARLSAQVYSAPGDWEPLSRIPE
jgi:hypothetical protein